MIILIYSKLIFFFLFYIFEKFLSEYLSNKKQHLLYISNLFFISCLLKNNEIFFIKCIKIIAKFFFFDIVKNNYKIIYYLYFNFIYFNFNIIKLFFNNLMIKLQFKF